MTIKLVGSDRVRGHFLLEIVIKPTILDQIQVGFGFFALMGVGAWPFLSFVGPYKPDSFIFDPFLQIR
jgi:hypothetical protein